MIAVGGLSGTGKSLLARALAVFVPPAPGALVVRSDVERKLMFDVGETKRLPPAAYEADANAKVYRILTTKAARIAAAGHSVIVDAVYARAEERACLAAAAVSAKVAFRGLFLVADLKTRLARVSARTRDASDADARVAREQEDFITGRIEWAEIDASGPPDETLRRARTALK
jgi:hypothetical protein